MYSAWDKHKNTVICAVMVALFIAAVITWPVVVDPFSRLVGHPGNDTWNHVWGYWWVGEALSRGEFPLNADKLVFPAGGTLYFIDTIQAVVSWPVQLVFGPVFAFNFVMFTQIAFSGFAAWLLAWKLSGDSLSSYLAMVIYASAPHLLGQTYNGISETVCAGWFPLTLWALLRLMERPNRVRAIVLGCIGSCCILTSWYYGLFATIGSLVLFCWYAIRQSWLHDWRAIWKSVGVAVLTSAALIIAPLQVFRSSLSASDAIVTRDPEFVERSLLNHNITDIFAFINPTTVASPDLFSLYGEELIIVIYIGWIGLLLAFFGILSAPSNRPVRPWIWLGVVFFLFSLGPYLNAGGEYLKINDQLVPLPFLALYKALPIFDRISHPFRFVMGVQLVVALLASEGFRGVLNRFRLREQSRFPLLLVLLLSIAIGLEVRYFSPAVLPISSSDATLPEVYDQLVEEPADGAVLDLPLSIPNLERAIYVWAQSKHERPVPWGLNDPMPQALRVNHLTQTLVKIEATRARELPILLPELNLVIASRNLSRIGYRYIIVHRRFYPAFKADQVEHLLTALLGKPKLSDAGTILLYTLPETHVKAVKTDNESGEIENTSGALQ